MWQNQGGSNWKFHDNICVDSEYADVFIEPESPNISVSNVWVYNNVFIKTTNLLAASEWPGQEPVAVLIGGEVTNYNSYFGVIIANNTVVDYIGGNNVIALNQYSRPARWVNSIAANNLIWNSSSNGILPLVLYDGTNTGWTAYNTTNGMELCYNYIGAGVAGGTGCASNQIVAPTGCTVAGVCSTPVTFKAYTEWGGTKNDLHLTNDTACTGQGMNLSGYFNVNYDGTTNGRPAVGAWNIGAY